VASSIGQATRPPTVGTTETEPVPTRSGPDAAAAGKRRHDPILRWRHAVRLTGAACEKRGSIAPPSRAGRFQRRRRAGCSTRARRSCSGFKQRPRARSTSVAAAASVRYWFVRRFVTKRSASRCCGSPLPTMMSGPAGPRTRVRRARSGFRVQAVSLPSMGQRHGSIGLPGLSIPLSPMFPPQPFDSGIVARPAVQSLIAA
jgi:hypothetical protein